jgi:ornithine cyclodeaminase/alanine dehydrogenase-like protein (mu-crystallin family)
MHGFSEDEVQQLLSGDNAIAALEAAFRRDWRRTAKMPNRMHIDLAEGVTLLVMPCADPELLGAGMKVVTVRPEIASGEPRVQAVFFWFGHATGQLEATLQANHLTAVRTAGLSAVATRALARPDARVLGIFGTGVQAWSHLRMVALVRNFGRFLVCGSSPARSRSFAARAGHAFGVEVDPVDAATCAREADVLCACTTSTTPLFDGRLVRAGAHLNLVGAFQPGAREVDEAVMGRARIVVDTLEGALAEAGDLLIPLRRGEIARDAIADLHEVLSGKKPGRDSAEQVTVFKSVGCAYEDLVLAKLVCDAGAGRAFTAE